MGFCYGLIIVEMNREYEKKLVNKKAPKGASFYLLLSFRISF